MTFNEHKEQTAKDCEEVSLRLKELANDVRDGNLLAFEQFWLSGGTEEGDAKIIAMIELIMLRYQYRLDNLE